jgi:hypothetical protein
MMNQQEDVFSFDMFNVPENNKICQPPINYKNNNMLFPLMLHSMLESVERNGDNHIISWLSDNTVRK